MSIFAHRTHTARITRAAVCMLTVTSLTLTPTTVPAQQTGNETAGAATTMSGPGMAAAGSDALVSTNVTLGDGEANWDWVRSFRNYVGLQQETRTNVELDQYHQSLLWPVVPGQQVDVDNLHTLRLNGSVHWTHHGGELDVTLANPTVDFVNRKLLVDGATKGTLAAPGVAVDKKQTALLELPDLKAEVKDGYLLVTSFQPKITHFSHELVGFYEGETREPFVATIKINEMQGDRPAPILWQLFPDKYEHLRPSNHAPNDPNFVDVEVPVDPALAKCIRWELDIDDASAPIMKSHLLKLRTLQCNGINTPEAEKVRSLEGLQYAKHLSRVNFRSQRVEDLSPLRDHPTIVELDISGNNLSEINGLGYLPKLGKLKANDNQLVNIDQVATLANLESLHLNNNQLFHLRSLPHNKDNLRDLQVSGNEIEDISPLEHYKYLKTVGLSNNNIVTVDALGTIRGVERIDLSDNFIEDITPLKKLLAFDNLRSLKLANNRLTDREQLAEFGSKITDIPATGELAQNNRDKPATKTAPMISAQPVSVGVDKGQQATFTVAATGNPEPVYQWQKKIGADWVNLPGERATTLTVPADAAANGAQYRVAVRNAVGTVLSDAATLTVQEPATPSAEPSSAAPSATSEPKPSAEPSAQPAGSSTKAVVGIVALVLALIGGIASAMHLPALQELIAKLIRM